MKLGVNREREVTELEEAHLRRLPLASGASLQVGVGEPNIGEHSVGHDSVSQGGAP
jgi:hypothetical protein